MEIHGNLSLIGGGQIAGIRIDNLASDPVAPGVGQMWMNTVAGIMRFNNGVSVIDIADGAALLNYLELAGGTMTGAITLSGAPTLDLHASSKLYVDQGLALKENALGFVPVNKAGDAVTGNLNFQGTSTVTGLSSPTVTSDAATKGYVDSALAGLDFQADIISVQLTAAEDPGVSPVLGDRYIITDIAALNVNFGTITGVANNDIVEYDGTNFVVSYDVSIVGAGAISWVTTLGKFYYYDGVAWAEFGGLAGITAGVGLVKAGNTLDINMGAGIIALPTDEVGIDLLAASGLQLTDDGTTDSVLTSAKLQVRLDGTTLSKSAAGVKVGAGGITEAELNISVAGAGLVGGAGVALAVGVGTGINVAADAISFDIAFGDARYANLTGDTFTGTLTLAGDPATALEASTKQYVDSVNTRITNSFFVQNNSAAPSLTHIVTHNIGQKYCNITVVDATDQVIIPDTITYDTVNQLTVTFTAATACIVIVNGVA